MGKHKMVQHDTLPRIDLFLKNTTTDEPIDLTDAGTIVRGYLKKVGASEVKETLTLQKIPGRVVGTRENEAGETVLVISEDAPFDVDGMGGGCAIVWGPSSLDEVGDFTVEVEITWAGGAKQTIYEREKISVRADDNGA